MTRGAGNPAAHLLVLPGMRSTMLVLLLLATACGEQPIAEHSPAPPSAVPQSTRSDGILVALWGAPAKTARGVVWCPGHPADDDCAGILVTALPAGTSAVLNQSQFWRVEGVYDGVTVRATGAPQPVEYKEPNFTTPCKELRGLSSETGGSDLAVSDAVARYVATIPERHAGTWWDRGNSVLTVLLTGNEVADHRAALEAAVGDRGTVCVVGGARWSAADLQQATRRALEIAIEEGMGPWAAGPDAVANRVDLDVERSDEATIARIEQEAGAAVHVRAFLTVRDGALASLPSPPARGDVELETAQTRDSGGMDALGVFTLRFDEQDACVYGEFGQERLGVIWPFAYYAESTRCASMTSAGG